MGSGHLQASISVGFRARGWSRQETRAAAVSKEQGKGRKPVGSKCGLDPALPQQPQTTASQTGWALAEAGWEGPRLAGGCRVLADPAGLRSQKPV